MTKHLSRATCALAVAAVLLGGAAAEASKIGSPRYDAFVWGITPDAPTHPLLSREPALLHASDADAVNGKVLLKHTLGTHSSGIPAEVLASVENDGDTFWVRTDTPSHYQTANPQYIGGAAQVLVFQSFVKDTADAKLTYTYTYADVWSFVNPERGALCPLGDDGFCLRAEVLSTAAVMRGDSSSSGGEVWRRIDGALVTSQPFAPNMGGYTTGSWPWAINTNPSPGNLGVRVSLLHSQTQEVDLSGIAVGETFSVWYDLYAYAYDRANLYDLAIGWSDRGAYAMARDPLGGDTGVSFDLSGLTPTNNPLLPAVPEAQSWAMLASGLALLIVRVKRRRAAAW